MLTNNSGKWLMLDKGGNVVEGEDNPAAVSVLAAPGVAVPRDLVDKYDLADRLAGDPAPLVDSAGNPVAVVDGRAVAVSALPEGHPARADHERGLADHPATGAEKAPKSGVTIHREGSEDAPAKPHGKPHEGHKPTAGHHKAGA